MEKATNKEAADTMLSLEQAVAERVLGIVIDAIAGNPASSREIGALHMALRENVRVMAREEALSVTRASLSSLENYINRMKHELY